MSFVNSNVTSTSVTVLVQEGALPIKTKIALNGCE